MDDIKNTKKKDSSTEQKIKEAARTVFYKKGFAATRTRDIANEADINLALLNYYFRSKAKLFEIIMVETLHGFVERMAIILNDDNTTLDQKVQLVAEKYIDFIIKEPEIPTFIISEIRNNPHDLLRKLPIDQVINRSKFYAQYREAVKQGRITEHNPLQFLMNLIGLVIFPFVAKPLVMGIGHINYEEFISLMKDRKRKIPIWVKNMMLAG
ncbi:TetR/AcrR family transcriptional regulator [Niabella terrae]